MRQRMGGLVVMGIAAIFLAFPQTSWGIGGFAAADCVREGVLGKVLRTTAVAHMVNFEEDDAVPKTLFVDALLELGLGSDIKAFRVHLDYRGIDDTIPLVCALIEDTDLTDAVIAHFALPSAATQLFISGDPGDGITIPPQQSGISQADTDVVPGSLVTFGKRKNITGYDGEAKMAIARFNIVACDPTAAGTTCP